MLQFNLSADLAWTILKGAVAFENLVGINIDEFENVHAYSQYPDHGVFVRFGL